MSNFEQFGKYVLLEKIAAGGMAEVYLAKSAGANNINKFVAIKKILPQYSQNHEFVQFFKSEAEVTINLSHSNIVSIYDFGIENEQFFLVMELVEGKNLRQVINELKKINKSITIEQSIFIVKEASAGLDHAHRCVDTKTGKPLNITHRDMSPQNVMISFEGEVKVIDFGIAKAETEGEATKAGTLKGKFAYMSPEQSEGYPIDPRTDVFALGIILWELLANDRLFTGSNEAAILRKVRECQIPSIRKINPLVPVELEKIVMKALAKDRNVRYQTAANLHKDLNRFLNTQYPDFASQDFSAFIKESFKSTHAEWREKFIKFSQVVNTASVSSNSRNKAAPFDALSDKLPPIPKNQKSPESKKLQSSEQVTEAPDFERANKENNFPDIKIKLDGLRNASVNKTTTAHVTNHSNENLKKSSNTAVRRSVPGQTSITHSKYIAKKTSSSDLFVKFIFLVLLGGGTYYYYINNYLANKPNSIAQIPPQPKEGRADFASKTPINIRVSVSSSPSGAKILIDGNDTGYRTPSVVLVPEDIKSKITLEHEDFFSREVEKVFKSTDSITFNLERRPQPGFINIYVSNGGPTTVIYINGKRIAEHPPLKKYPVTANSQLIIKAENPVTQTSDTQKIVVLPNKTYEVEMILGRKPAQQR